MNPKKLIKKLILASLFSTILNRLITKSKGQSPKRKFFVSSKNKKGGLSIKNNRANNNFILFNFGGLKDKKYCRKNK